MLPGIGVFGTGAEVEVLVSILREKGFTIEAIWGRSVKEAQDAAHKLNIQFYTNKIDEVLLKKDVDLVFINCPPFLHSQISVKALGIGKHVVCDKPMGLGLSDALKMVRGAQYYPSLISLVNHSLRFLPAFSQMKKALQDEYIGPQNEIFLVDIRIQIGSLLHDRYDWLCDASVGGGALNLIGSHVIDLVSYLTGNQAIRVHGLLRTYKKTTKHVEGIRQIAAPDFCNFQMELHGGTLVTASMHSNVSNNLFMQEVLISGRDGYLVVRGGDLFGHRNKLEKEESLYVDVQDLCSMPNILLPLPYIKGLSKMIGALKESFAQKQNGWIKEPVQTAATFEDGLYVQAVIDAIRKSSDTRNWIKVMNTTEYLIAEKMGVGKMSIASIH